MNAESSELIRAFVRGEQPWGTLEKAGIYVELRDDEYEIDNPWQVVAKASLRDIAQGLLAHRISNDQLRHWAGIILAGSSFLDLSELEMTSEGDILLSAIWDAAFGDQVSQEAVDVAGRLLIRKD